MFIVLYGLNSPMLEPGDSNLRHWEEYNSMS